MGTQAQEKARGAAGAATKVNLDAGRLPDEDVLEHAASGFAADPLRLARIVEALKEALGDLALPPALASSIAVEALYGEQGGRVLDIIAAELTAALEGAGGPPEEESGAVMRARAAFVNRIRGHVSRPDDE